MRYDLIQKAQELAGELNQVRDEALKIGMRIEWGNGVENGRQRYLCTVHLPSPQNGEQG